MTRALLLCLLCGCTRANVVLTDENDAGYAAGDLARAGDLASSVDLAGADLAGADLAAPPDLANATDLANAPDLANATDLGGASACAQSLATARFDFETGAQSFTHEATDGYAGDFSWPFDEWELGAPYGAGPGVCHGGSSCWGTHLAGNYAYCERAQLRSPVIDLSACAATPVKLVYWQWYDFWSGSFDSKTWRDGGRVEVSTDGGGSWIPAPGLGVPGTIAILGTRDTTSCLSPSSFSIDGQAGFTGASGAWVKVEIALSPSLRSSQFRVRFHYGTGVQSATSDLTTQRSVSRPGWYIDDLSVELQ